MHVCALVFLIWIRNMTYIYMGIININPHTFFLYRGNRYSNDVVCNGHPFYVLDYLHPMIKWKLAWMLWQLLNYCNITKWQRTGTIAMLTLHSGTLCFRLDKFHDRAIMFFSISFKNDSKIIPRWSSFVKETLVLHSIDNRSFKYPHLGDCPNNFFLLCTH